VLEKECPAILVHSPRKIINNLLSFARRRSMRGIITLATGGGGLPPRSTGGGRKGEASFEKRGAVSFKGGRARLDTTLFTNTIIIFALFAN
jgi:hypothetical protein